MQILKQVINELNQTAYQQPIKIEHFIERGISKEDVDKALEFLVNFTDVFRQSKRGEYVKQIRENVYLCKLDVNKRGFAFGRILTDDLLKDETQDDIFIPLKRRFESIDGDVVLVSKHRRSSKDRPEGTVICVVTRENERFVGTLSELQYGDFVFQNDNQKIDLYIVVPKKRAKGAVDGQKVLIELYYYDDDRRAKAEVREILGHENDPGVDILSTLHRLGIRQTFPKTVLEQIEKVPDIVSESEIENRKDLRSYPFITIDGADAKDLDDAVYLETTEDDGYVLYVSIADVSHYVTQGSPLDKEAFERGTSVYVVDRVVPMLPQKLSNGICSLHPNVDRLTLTCEMHITASGEVHSHEIYPSCIHSVARLTYTDVNSFLEGNDVFETDAPFTSMLSKMQHLAHILRHVRDEKGSIDFDIEESKILVDKQGIPTDIILRERGKAERLIEEFMLLANQTVAKQIAFLELPFLYRIHETPDEGKIREVYFMLQSMGRSLKTPHVIHPKTIQSIMKSLESTSEERVMNAVLLRAMQKAVYSEDNLGHFGLAFDYYTHFTSPIRRYPDLIVHRLLREYLFEAKLHEKKTLQYYTDMLPRIAEQSTHMERKAVEAERDVESMKKAEYMQTHIGETHAGVISGITSFGCFVELKNTIEGLVHITTLLDDHYIFDEDRKILRGERTQHEYRIGDHVTIRVTGASKEDRTIDFEILTDEKEQRTIEERMRKNRLK